MMRPHPIKQLPVGNEKSLKTLVENRTAYTLDSYELNVFETHERTELVPLTFNDFVVTSMVRGKKIMHLYDDPGFDYLPGETVLVPAGVTMEIDFPEAREGNPTQCIALAIDNLKIQQTLHYLNERYPRQGGYWQFQKSNYHFSNSNQLAGIIDKIIEVCVGNSPCKDVLADLALQELIVSIVQVQQLQATVAPLNIEHNNPLSFIVAYIKSNLSEDIRMETLSAKACMSKATFYRTFKREYGVTPHEFILKERMRKAKQLLSESNASVKSICYECGFSDVNYFVRLFGNIEGITPKQYQMISHHRNSA